MKNKKTLLIVLSIISIVTIAIIGLASFKTDLAKAKADLKIAQDTQEVIQVWQKYAKDLSLANSKVLMKSIKDKLEQLEISDQELHQILDVFPKAPKSLNVIVVPDLSRRIIDQYNNPDQILNDKALINTIWDEFVQVAKYKKQSSDYFGINLTDLDQAQGTFSKISDDLRFDLSEKEKNKPNRTLFSDSLNNIVKARIDQLYSIAENKPLGADYRYYIRRYLPNQLKTPDLSNDFRNKLIIITDGYLEAENQSADTKITGYEKELKTAVLNGTIKQKIKALALEIPPIDIDLSNTDVLICEVNERKNGKGYHFEILQAYWTMWFESMGAKSVTFLGREQSLKQSQKHIKQYLKK